MVRYRVLKKCFVNGDLIDPEGRPDVFVMAAPGLEGTALELVADKATATKDAAKK
jgi:hypothetical protein